MRILAARWVLPVVSEPIEQGAIAIENERIAAVGLLSELEAKFPDAPVQDLGEAAILPGLINIHTHLELTLFRGRLEYTDFFQWILELITLKRDRLSPDHLRLSARLGCLEAIRSGITTVADTAHADAVVPALIQSGQRGVVFQECFGPAKEQAAASAAELEAALDVREEQLQKAGSRARSLVKLGVSPHAPYSISADLYRLSVDIARRRGLDMALHVAESPDEELFMREGKGTFADSLRERGIPWNHPAESTISYLNELGVLERSPLLIHCVQADERDLQLIAASRSRIAHCPKSNAKLGHGIAPINRALSMGIRIGLGTDSVASNNNCDLIEEARFGVLLHRARGKSAIDARQALRMMTIESARALDLDGVCGSLEAGKQADVIAIDLSSVHNTPHYDPVSAVIDSCSGRDCILTIVAGKVLFEGGTVETIDEERTLLEASAAAASLRT